MAILLENSLPNIITDGLNTDKAVVLGSTLAVTGATTFTIAPTGPVVKTVTQNALVGATVVLTAAQSGGVFVNRSTSGTASWTLPTNVSGLVYTFVVASTTSGFTLTGGTFKFKTTATGTALSGTTLTNTQGTSVVGDTITFVADGTNWLMTAQSGIFAAS